VIDVTGLSLGLMRTSQYRIEQKAGFADGALSAKSLANYRGCGGPRDTVVQARRGRIDEGDRGGEPKCAPVAPMCTLMLTALSAAQEKRQLCITRLTADLRLAETS
jgi:hypothetical protein